MNTAIRDQILQAEKARCQAMINNDAAALGQLLDEELSFHHATGAVDSKSAYLEKMASGKIEYQSIDWPESKVTCLSNAAVMTGKMLTAVKVEGVAKQLDNRVTAVWRQHGDHWQLLAFQSTPIKSS